MPKLLAIQPGPTPKRAPRPRPGPADAADRSWWTRESLRRERARQRAESDEAQKAHGRLASRLARWASQGDAERVRASLASMRSARAPNLAAGVSAEGLSKAMARCALAPDPDKAIECLRLFERAGASISTGLLSLAFEAAARHARGTLVLSELWRVGGSKIEPPVRALVAAAGREEPEALLWLLPRWEWTPSDLGEALSATARRGDGERSSLLLDRGATVGQGNALVLSLLDAKDMQAAVADAPAPPGRGGPRL